MQNSALLEDFPNNTRLQSSRGHRPQDSPRCQYKPGSRAIAKIEHLDNQTWPTEWKTAPLAKVKL